LPDRGIPSTRRFLLIKPVDRRLPPPHDFRKVWRESLLPFSAAFAALTLLHLPLLRLPYFWDEAGYYIPAAHDLLLTGDLIPHSTAVNPHPPLVMISFVLAWKAAGFHILVTRLVMLLWSAFALTGLFRLSRRVANTEVAVGAVVLTAIYPVFFTQSTMAHLDVAAAALTFWGLLYYLERRPAAFVLCFSLAVLAKETAIVTPLALFCWEVVCWAMRARPAMRRLCARTPRDLLDPLYLLIPCAPLAGWMAYQYMRTGFLLGDPVFVRYNLTATLAPARFFYALVQRLWQLGGHMNLYVLLAATLLAMFYPALPESRAIAGRVVEMPIEPTSERQRIAIPTQIVFAVITLAHLLLLSLLGGAVLARYMLPVVPLFVLICVSTLRRRVSIWPYVLAIVGAGFVIALFVNPPYRFAFEDNLAYRDYVLLHQDAAGFLEQHYAKARVLTAWPASDELTRPFIGYVHAPLNVLRIENFTAQEIEAAAQRPDFDAALLFSTKYEPSNGSPMDWLTFWRRAQERYFDYHRDLPPELAAQILGGRILYLQRRGGQWIAVVEVARVLNARR
jgi:hypothetical protein